MNYTLQEINELPGVSKSTLYREIAKSKAGTEPSMRGLFVCGLEKVGGWFLVKGKKGGSG